MAAIGPNMRHICFQLQIFFCPWWTRWMPTFFFDFCGSSPNCHDSLLNMCVCHLCISNKLSRQIVGRIWLFKALWCDIAPILAHWFHGNAIKPCVDFVFWFWPGHTVSRDSLVNIQLNLRWAIFMELRFINQDNKIAIVSLCVWINTTCF